jgi:hypothetical protein
MVERIAQCDESRRGDVGAWGVSSLSAVASFHDPVLHRENGEIGSRASGADAASARTLRLWPYEHQPGIDRGEHSVVHFQVRFVSLTFVALFIALSVIVSKD